MIEYNNLVNYSTKGLKMKKTIFWLMITALVGMMGTGCAGTVKGVKQDAGNAYDATKETVQEIGN